MYPVLAVFWGARFGMIAFILVNLVHMRRKRESCTSSTLARAGDAALGWAGYACLVWLVIPAFVYCAQAQQDYKTCIYSHANVSELCGVEWCIGGDAHCQVKSECGDHGLMGLSVFFTIVTGLAFPKTLPLYRDEFLHRYECAHRGYSQMPYYMAFVFCAVWGLFYAALLVYGVRRLDLPAQFRKVCAWLRGLTKRYRFGGLSNPPPPSSPTTTCAETVDMDVETNRGFAHDGKPLEVSPAMWHPPDTTVTYYMDAIC